MKTILEAKSRIANLWGFPKPNNVIYRLLKYVLQCELTDGLLLHNVVTGQLIYLTQEEKLALHDLPGRVDERLAELIKYHFLVPESFDEYKSVNQIRSIYQKFYSGDDINHYVILPTTFCNARCFYCYESDYPHVSMSEKTAFQIVDYIDKHRKDKDVTIQWFGGEPLVGLKSIDLISQGLKDRGVKFVSTMISNGYLFDEKVVEKSVNLWNLQRVQITLDGPENVYNHVKAYVAVKDNPFHRVLHNIDFLTNRKVQVNIRLNVDFYNKDDIRGLIEELGSRYSGNKFVSIYLNMLFSDQGFEPVRHSQDDILVLLDIIADYTERLKEMGLAYDGQKLPFLKASQCMADNPHSVMIQPDGSFCRCEHESVFENYGNIFQGVLDPQRVLKWHENIERSEYCPDCSLYPSCYLLRNCMNAEAPCVERYREDSKKKYLKNMLEIYKKKVWEGDNENFCES